jgi:flagellin-like hook-associated protein FlgL
MSISAISLRSTLLDRSMTDLRATFDDLTRQLSSGQVSTTYGGLGSGRALALAMQAKISAMQAHRQTIGSVDLRVSMLSTTLSRLNTMASEQRSDTDPNDNTFIVNGQTRAQLDARDRLEEALSVLGTDIAGTYIFGGRATDKSPVLAADKILDGDGTRIGLRGVIAERRAADVGIVDTDLAGTDSAGRLAVSPSTGSGFTIAEDGVHGFGFKLSGGATTIPGGSVSTPAGSPPALDVALTTQPAEGNTIRLTLSLPDGTTDDIVLTAKPVADDPSEFQIGATVADTVSNLRGAIVAALATRVQTTLAAASSVVAGKTFFAAGPQTPVDRVAFTPPATAATATALRPSTPTDTVIWYTGDDDPALAPRDSATAQIDSGMSVNFGVRANEEGIAKAVRSFAILAAEVYPSGDPNAADRNFALSDRVRTALAPDSSVGSLTAITTELSGSQRAAKAADSRLATAINSAQDLVDGVEKADDQEVAASLLAVQTRLQASYQTTAMLSKLSLVNFID